MTFYTHPSLEIAGLLPEAITKHRNAIPLPHTPGAPTSRGTDVTVFLHKYECLAHFTGIDPSSKDVISMFPYYCTEGLDVREKVIMMQSYERRDWAALKTEMLDAFRHTDMRALVYTHRYLEQLCAEFGGRDDTEALKTFLRTCDHISGVVTQRGMMCEYERTEMFLRALPKRLWRKAVTKLGMHPFEPSTFDYGKLHSWVTAKITAAEALAVFEFLAPAAALPTTSTAPPAPTTSLAPMSSIIPTAPTESQALPASPAPATPTDLMTPTTTPASIASTTLTATITSPALPSSAPTISPASPMSLAPIPSPAPTAPVPLMTGTPTTSPAPTASTASTPPARIHTARQGTIRAGPTVRLGIIRVEPPREQTVRRHHYAQPDHRQKPAKPHRSESTITCRSEPAPLNRPKPGQPQREPEPMQPHGQEPAPPNRQEVVPPAPCLDPVQPKRDVPPYRQEVVQPPPCQDPVQLPQRDVPPCYYCGNDQHNLRKCADLRTDLEKGIVSINNHDRLVLGPAGGEIPLEPAAHDFRTIRDYARAGAPILPPSPAPRARSPLPPPPPPAQSSRTSTPLLTPEQLTQLMREVTEHFAQSRQYEVDVQDPPPPSPPAQLSSTYVRLPSPEQLTQLVREVTEHFAQHHLRQTARPPATSSTQSPNA